MFVSDQYTLLPVGTMCWHFSQWQSNGTSRVRGPRSAAGGPGHVSLRILLVLFLARTSPLKNVHQPTMTGKDGRTATFSVRKKKKKPQPNKSSATIARAVQLMNHGLFFQTSLLYRGQFCVVLTSPVWELFWNMQRYFQRYRRTCC